VIERIRQTLTLHPPRSAAPREGATDWRGTLQRRTRVAAILFGLWAVGIEAKLVYLQVFRHADMVARASRQQMHRIVSPAERGDIIDRKGRVLATSVDADSIYAVPSEIENPDETVAKLCQAFRNCTPKERQSLSDRLRQQRFFTYVRRQVSPDETSRVAALNLDGILFMKESRRFYPNRELGAHLLGYVGIDGNGLGGIESAYDPQIRGTAGTVLIQTDARRHAFSRTERPPTVGSTVELSIDEYLQHIAERELHAGVLENRAAGGTAIIMNPHTGEILALANEPTFNPNSYREATEIDRRNRAVQDLYEPGSTFKVVTASAAIEENVMSVDAPIDVSGGQIRLGTRVVRDAHPHSVLSFTDVLVMSSNVGAIKIGFRVGAERLGKYVQRYGFGHPVSSDFPGESPGIVWDPSRWSDSALMSVSMGYQIGVTPLQMATAVSAVANGGELVEPHVIRAMYHDNRRYAVQPKVVRRTTSADTASALTTIMEGVVDRGTAKAAQIPGYTIAGKTGTAHKLISGHYSRSEYNASFVGFLPSRDPAVTIIVVLDSPHATSYYGGIVAAPIFKRIAESTLRHLGIAPTINPATPVMVTRTSTGPNSAGSSGNDDGPSVATANSVSAHPIVSLVADGPAGTVPDVRGLSAREAVRTLARLGLIARVTGDGFVVSQEPAAETPAETGGVCRLVLDRIVFDRMPLRPLGTSFQP
jgi:cell division protein FtsI (penicillin-binding protein 3)